MSNEKDKKKKFGIFQWIVFAGIVPLIIAVAVILAIFTIRGINVFEEVQKIPVIGKIMTDEKDVQGADENAEKTISDLQAKLKNEEAKSIQLQAELEKKERQLVQLDEEKKRLEQQLNETRKSGSSVSKDWDSVVKTYETMSPKNAALILVEMDETIALQILSRLTEEQLADVLEKMPPENAARFTDQLAERVLNE